MADLLIKGLEMPKGDLALWISVHKDGTVEYIDSNKYEGYKTLRKAAVTVPPHGRLGDLDLLEKNINILRIKAMERGEDANPYWFFLDKILQTKTIIPASGEVDDGQI